VGPSKQFRGMAQQLGWGRSDSDNVRYLGKFGVLLTKRFTVPDPKRTLNRDAEQSRWIATIQGTLPTGIGIFVVMVVL